MQLTVNTQTAIHALKNHRAVHQEEYANQLTGWQERMKWYGESLQGWAADGGGEDRPIQPDKPEKFDNAYKRLLQMLEVHELDTILLEEHEFDQIFLDRFNWKSKFINNSTLYSGGLLSVGDDDNY